MSANNIVCQTDSDGNTYTLCAPNEVGSFSYSDLRDGTVLVVLRIKKEEFQKWELLGR